MYTVDANTVVFGFIILNCRINGSVWKSTQGFFYRSRVSSEELYAFIVLITFYKTFKSQKIVKLLPDVDLVSHDCNYDRERIVEYLNG